LASWKCKPRPVPLLDQEGNRRPASRSSQKSSVSGGAIASSPAAAICSAISILLRSGMTTDRWPLSFRRPAAAECEPCVVLSSSRLLSGPAGQGLDCLVRRFTTGLRGRPHSRILSAHLGAFGRIRQRSQLNLAASLKLRPWRGHSFLQLLRSDLTPCSLHHAPRVSWRRAPFIHDGGRGGGPRLIVKKATMGGSRR
jgi:hypothetical protein